LIEMRKAVSLVQQQVFINLALEPLVQRFKELGGVYISGSFPAAKHTFVLPKNEWVDPLKDVQADVEEIRAGLATFEDKLAERGVEDIDAHIAMLKAFQKLDLTLTTNPEKMKTTEDAQGAAPATGGKPVDAASASKPKPVKQPEKPE
jgi:hypothetical protein